MVAVSVLASSCVRACRMMRRKRTAGLRVGERVPEASQPGNVFVLMRQG